jgi:uncharacterized protein
MTITISQLSVYPIKSMQGLNLTQAQVNESGFQFDRQFMLSQLDGTFITARQYPQLLLLKPKLTNTGLMITAPNESSIMVHYNEFSSQPESTNVWGNYFYSHIASIKVNRWFSDYLQRDVQLRWLGHASTRRIKHYPTLPLSFADGYPYLLLNRSSFDEVNRRCRQSLAIPQFRGNIIIDGAPPFSEDTWKTIKIGEVIFEVTKPCSRCILTTVDVKTAQPAPNKQPLSVLSTFRRDEKGEIDFGINMIALNQGVLNIGDKVELLATKPAKQYIITSAVTEPIKTQQPLPTQQPITIEYHQQNFIGNTQQTLLEQLEHHNINVSYSCRVGLCGKCRVRLVSGKIKPLTKSAIQTNNQILACSCIPKGNIKIDLK